MLWDWAREKGVFLEVWGDDKGWVAYYHGVKPEQKTKADSGPRAITLAIARATGWEEPKA